MCIIARENSASRAEIGEKYQIKNKHCLGAGASCVCTDRTELIVHAQGFFCFYFKNETTYYKNLAEATI